MNKALVSIVLALVVLGGVMYTFLADNTKQQAVPATSVSNITEQNSSSALKKETVTVTYTDGGFSPQSIEIAKGSTVNFVNKSSIPIWVASDPHPQHTDYPEFDTPMAIGRLPEMGDDFIFTFDKAGIWKYHSHTASGDGTDVGLHPGTITVK